MYTLILGALDEEVSAIRAAMQSARQEKAGAFDVTCGRVGERNIIVCRCGIGKVHAAAATAAILTAFAGADGVINTGVAGGLDPALARGDVVLGTKTVQHDFDSTADGLQRGQVAGFEEVYFPADEKLLSGLERALQNEKIAYRKGCIASGDIFVADVGKAEEIRALFGASVCEMESAAIAQVCALFGVPFVALRAVSDDGREGAVESFYAFLHRAADTNARAVLRYLQS